MNNRLERERELYRLMQSSDGQDQIIGMFMATGQSPKPGMLLSYMIEVILDASTNTTGDPTGAQ